MSRIHPLGFGRPAVFLGAAALHARPHRSEGEAAPRQPTLPTILSVSHPTQLCFLCPYPHLLGIWGEAPVVLGVRPRPTPSGAPSRSPSSAQSGADFASASALTILCMFILLFYVYLILTYFPHILFLL